MVGQLYQHAGLFSPFLFAACSFSPLFDGGVLDKICLPSLHGKRFVRALTLPVASRQKKLKERMNIVRWFPVERVSKTQTADKGTQSCYMFRKCDWSKGVVNDSCLQIGPDCADVSKMFPYFNAWSQRKSNEDKLGLALTIALKVWKGRKTTSTLAWCVPWVHGFYIGETWLDIKFADHWAFLHMVFLQWYIAYWNKIFTWKQL